MIGSRCVSMGSPNSATAGVINCPCSPTSDTGRGRPTSAATAGHDRARRRRRDYRIPLLVDDVAALIDAAAPSETVLIAHDWGGALGLVLRDPAGSPARQAGRDEHSAPDTVPTGTADVPSDAQVVVRGLLPVALAAREGARPKPRRGDRQGVHGLRGPSGTLRRGRRSSSTAAQRASPERCARCSTGTGLRS